ncbi:MAG: AbrB family transcriptional regulator, partial [Rhodospirillales bacterium]|nr:AbrB family transcriptional regulator [Rhodospirillales bacterium]
MTRHVTDLLGNWRSCLLTLSVGFAGAIIFAWVKLPLPWVTGPLFFTVILALSGVRLWMPGWLRSPSMVVLGILFGTAASPDL